ncbi:MAG: response regulator transcription factor [Hyphomicrobiales bacterium]|nr:response regulator transcription factor [Hyphomicrobiales bacterium]MCP5370867.1 response regulator transcription factor [Hyphomicrobiales bacterium]
MPTTAGPGDFDAIKVLLVDSHWQLRSTFAASLQAQGFRDVVSTARLETVRRMLAATPIDLLIVDLERFEREICTLAGRLRSGESDLNQFTIMIALAADTGMARTMRIIDAGFDDLLVKPFSLEDLHRRIGRFLRIRRRFIVASDYIGPDRRHKPRHAWGSDPAIEVPNTLAEKAGGAPVATGLRARMAAARREIDRVRIELCAGQIAWLVDRIRLSHADGPGDSGGGGTSIAVHMRELRRVVEEALARGQRSGLTTGLPACEDILRVVDGFEAVTRTNAATTLGGLAVASRRFLNALGTHPDHLPGDDFARTFSTLHWRV